MKGGQLLDDFHRQFSLLIGAQGRAGLDESEHIAGIVELGPGQQLGHIAGEGAGAGVAELGMAGPSLRHSSAGRLGRPLGIGTGAGARIGAGSQIRHRCNSWLAGS